MNARIEIGGVTLTQSSNVQPVFMQMNYKIIADTPVNNISLSTLSKPMTEFRFGPWLVQGLLSESTMGHILDGWTRLPSIIHGEKVNKMWIKHHIPDNTRPACKYEKQHWWLKTVWIFDGFGAHGKVMV